MALWTAPDYGAISNRVCWTLAGLTCLTVILRFVCRICFARGMFGRLGPDDLITAVCTVLLVITCVFITIGAQYGLGRPEKTLSSEDTILAIKWNAIINCVIVWVFSLPKFALIAILKRILDYGWKTATVFWGVCLSCQACILATSIWWFAQCHPVAYQWDKSIPGGTCASPEVMSRLAYATSVFSAFLDIFFAFYPIPFVMRLNMPLKNRIAVCVALSLSGLAFAISVYKLAIIQDAFHKQAQDATYPVPFLDIFGIAEGAILVICASLPTLGPLFRLAKGKIRSYGSQNSKSHQSNTHSQNRSAPSEGGWSNIRGHKLQDPENGSTGMHSSVDDIPLVSSAIRHSHYIEDHSHKDEHVSQTTVGY